MAVIEFLRNEARKVEGLAYAGFETFRGSPFISCARETGQNSRDARAGEDAVKVSYDLLELPREEVPFADDLEASVKACLNSTNDEETLRHLERALDQISSDTIRMLRISDENTTGLTGPVEDPESVFTALVKGDGVTNKADVDSAGSFGIGKNAAFAVTDLQTVIYSTCWQDDDGERQFAAQGRLRLISHERDGNGWSAEGYWGLPDFHPVTDSGRVPNWMTRDRIGTSIFAIGFRQQEEWAARMALSLATNFFLAIERGEIEFNVAGGFILNSSTIASHLESELLAATAAGIDQKGDLERAHTLLECILSDRSIRAEIEVSGLGAFYLHLLVGEGLPREVHILRNGIYITSNFAKFDEPMKRFPGTREFVAVLEPVPGDRGRRASELLKKTENPAHDAFEPERIVDAEDQAVARVQIKELIRKVRDCIRSEAKIEDVDRDRLDELNELFADAGTDPGVNDDETEKDPSSFEYGEAKRTRRKRHSGTASGNAGEKRGGTGDGSRPGRRKKKGRRKKGAGVSTAIPITGVRSRLADGSGRRDIWFTPSSGGNAVLVLQATGLTSVADLSVSDSTTGIISDGRIQLELSEGQRVHLNVEFAEPYAGPLELTLQQDKRAGGDAA